VLSGTILPFQSTITNCKGTHCHHFKCQRVRQATTKHETSGVEAVRFFKTLVNFCQLHIITIQEPVLLIFKTCLTFVAFEVLTTMTIKLLSWMYHRVVWYSALKMETASSSETRYLLSTQFPLSFLSLQVGQ
jgi:hypothetical protein